VLLLDTTKDGTTLPKIKNLVPNSPALAQGVPDGWYIIAVNEVPCKNKSLEDVVSHIRGEVGTPVTLSLADNPQGKKAKSFTIVRAVIQQPAANVPAMDPAAAFNADCENEARKLKKQGFTIIKTFNSDCGDYFFNFDADNSPYHARVFTMETKTSAGYTKGFEASASLFDNADETVKIPLKSAGSHEQGNSVIAELEGVMTFKRNSIGAVNMQIHPVADVKKCVAVYVIVYK